MKQSFLLITTVFVIILGAHYTSNAQSSLLKKVIVSPSQIDVAPTKSGRSITIVTAKDIEKMAANSVEDVLANIQGVNINARGGFGVQNDVGIRGSTFSQTLILLDNVRVNEALTGHYNLYIPIAMNEIAQIEIVRGPAASAYGADAVGGLIHIKTKNYLVAKHDSVKELSTKGSALIGENRLHLIDAVIDTKNKQVYFGASVNVKNSMGQIFDNPNHVRDSALDKTYRTDFDIKNYSVFGNYFLSKNTKVYTRVALNTRDFNAKYFYTNSTYDESVEKINSIWTQVGLQHNGKNQKTQIGIAYKQLGDEFIFNPFFAKNNHTTKNIVINLQQQRNLSSQWKVAYGLQSIFQQITSGDRGNHKNNTQAAFASVQYNPIAKITINGSARLEENSNYGGSFIPQIGASYRPNNHIVIRSSAGMANRAPDFTERYISTNLPTLSAGRNLGNPNLKPEKSFTCDIGFEYYTKKEKLFSVTVFGRSGSNLIDYVLTNSDVINTNVNLAPQSDYFYTQNITVAKTYGLETCLQKTIRVSENSQLQLGINYTYLKTTTENNEPSKYISNHPGHMANLQLAYQARYFDVMLNNNYRSRVQEDNVAVLGIIPENYLVSNAVLRIKPYKGKFNFVGKVLNIFDTQYQEILGAPMPQRWFSAGFDWKF